MVSTNSAIRRFKWMSKLSLILVGNETCNVSMDGWMSYDWENNLYSQKTNPGGLQLVSYSSVEYKHKGIVI